MRWGERSAVLCRWTMLELGASWPPPLPLHRLGRPPRCNSDSCGAPWYKFWSIFGLLFILISVASSLVNWGGISGEAIVTMAFAKSDFSHPKPAIWCIGSGPQITAPLRAACSVRDTSFQTLIRPHLTPPSFSRPCPDLLDPAVLRAVGDHHSSREGPHRKTPHPSSCCDCFTIGNRSFLGRSKEKQHSHDRDHYSSSNNEPSSSCRDNRGSGPGLPIAARCGDPPADFRH